MYRAIPFEDVSEWKRLLKQIGRKDVYYRREYCGLYHDLGDGEPYLFYYENMEGDNLCYVFIKRHIRNIQFVTNGLFKEDMYDIITPYGYGGPLYNRVNERLIKGFREEFEHYCREENIISEFIRFHPLLKNHCYLDEAMDVVYDRETIYIDLGLSRKKMFEQYHSNHRRNIRKARQHEGLEFKVFTKEEAIKQAPVFYDIYTETMDRVGASPYHYFSLDYVENLLSGLWDNSMIGAIMYKGEMISAALCMYGGGALHYHLGCSKEEYFYLGTNIYQFHNIALWGKEQGLNAFYLGGGHVGRDSLFKFKHRFSPNGILPFYIGKKIHNQRSYDLLAESWRKKYSQDTANGFFPVYRKEMEV